MRQSTRPFQDLPLLGIALAPVLTILAFCLRVDNALMRLLEAQGNSSPFIYGLLIGVLLRCILYLIPFKTTEKGARRKTRRKAVWTLDLLAGLLGLSLALFLGTAAPSSTDTLISGLAGALIGISLLGQLWQWGFAYFRSFPAHSALLVISVAFLLASILWLVCVIITAPLLLIAVLMALFVAGSLLLYQALRLSARKDQPPAPETTTPETTVPKTAAPNLSAFNDTRLALGRHRLNHCAPSSGQFAPAPSVRTPPLPQVVSSSARTDLGQIDSESGAQAFIGASLTELRAIMVFGWSALVGLLFNFFTLGLTFRPYPAGLTEGPLMPKPIAYLIVAAIVYLAIRIARDPSKVLGMLCRVILPITAAITLASPFLERIIVFSSTPLLSFVPYLGIAPFNVLGVAVVFLILQRAQTVDARLSPRLMTRACAVILAACAGSMAAGMAVFRLMGTDAQIVSLCILSAFLVLMTLTAILEGYRGTGDGRSIEHKQRDSCCDSLAERHGLSAREREVLGLLARGHGTKWIAEHLYISPETVRTHGKRIYEKMGVHTKEELLSKVEEHESATQAARFSRGL